MSTIKKIAPMVIAFGIGLSGCSLLKNSRTELAPSSQTELVGNDAMTKDKNVATPGEDAMKKGTEEANGENAQSMTKSGQYLAYDSEKVNEAAKNGKAVLFFHASWCPTCKAANEDITQNLSNIPAGLTIFKTDYDTYKDLEKKYGVTYQHTFVQVDENGNEIAKWNGGGLKEVVQNVK